MYVCISQLYKLVTSVQIIHDLVYSNAPSTSFLLFILYFVINCVKVSKAFMGSVNMHVCLLSIESVILFMDSLSACDVVDLFVTKQSQEDGLGK